MTTDQARDNKFGSKITLSLNIACRASNLLTARQLLQLMSLVKLAS